MICMSWSVLMCISIVFLSAHATAADLQVADEESSKQKMQRAEVRIHASGVTQQRHASKAVAPPKPGKEKLMRASHGHDFFALPDLGRKHPLWNPPTLCKPNELPAGSLHLVMPAYNFCPPVSVEYQRNKITLNSPPLPSTYEMLDSPAILATIATSVNMSMWLVNLGANPSSQAEDDKRHTILGDDCSALYPMGYHGVNFDVPANQQSMHQFYDKWPKAILETEATPPPQIVSKLEAHKVPKDLDFVKIDVDSFDCEFLSNMLQAGYRPKAMCLELAAPWPPPLKFMVNFSPALSFRDASGTAMSGCSLQMAVEILKPYGYTMLQYAMEDGWFVQDKFSHLFGKISHNITEMYDAGNPNNYGGFAWQAGGGIIHRLKALRGKPSEMLKEAQKGVEHLMQMKPALKTAKYTLKV